MFTHAITAKTLNMDLQDRQDEEPCEVFVRFSRHSNPVHHVHPCYPHAITAKKLNMDLQDRQDEELSKVFGRFSRHSNPVHRVPPCDISLDAVRSSITAIIGASGCDRTSFLQSLDRFSDLIPGYLNAAPQERIGVASTRGDFRRCVNTDSEVATKSRKLASPRLVNLTPLRDSRLIFYILRR